MNDQVEQFLKNEVTTSRFWVCADCGTENDSDAPCCAACGAPRENALPKRPFATPPSPPPGPNILRPAGSLTADSEEPADEPDFVVDDESEPAPEPIPWSEPEPVSAPEPPARQPFPTLPVLAALLPLLQNAALSLMWDQSLFRRAAVLAWLLAGVTMAAGIPLYMRLWRSERGLRRLLPPLCWIALAVVLLVLGQLLGRLGTFWAFLPKILLPPLAAGYFLTGLLVWTLRRAGCPQRKLKWACIPMCILAPVLLAVWMRFTGMI